MAFHGDNVSFTGCPMPLVYGEDDGCVAGLQRLLNAELPHAGLRHDGMFGPETLAATREFQARLGLPVTGKAGPDTLGMLKQLAPETGSLPLAAILLATMIMGAVMLTKKLLIDPGEPFAVTSRMADREPAVSPAL